MWTSYRGAGHQNLVPFVRVKMVGPETRVGNAELRLIPEEAGNTLANESGLECAPRLARENDTGTVRKQKIETIIRPSDSVFHILAVSDVNQRPNHLDRRIGLSGDNINAIAYPSIIAIAMAKAIFRRRPRHRWELRTPLK